MDVGRSGTSLAPLQVISPAFGWRPHTPHKGCSMASTMSLQDLFLDELRDLYDAEKQLIKALPKMAKKATSEDLRTAIESHLEETRTHVERLEQAFEMLE